jgi:hypothetical protein
MEWNRGVQTYGQEVKTRKEKNRKQRRHDGRQKKRNINTQIN